MEKEIGSKEVKKEPVTNPEGKGTEGSIQDELQKWSKEQLVQQVIQMNQQLYNQDNYIKGLRKQLGEAEQYFTNKRMEYLFKVVEIANNYRASDYPCFDSVFVEGCLKEIQEALTIPEQKEEENKEK